ncbi:MAG: hypothetical protein ACRD06_03865, partial [Terriglobia bacterium]
PGTKFYEQVREEMGIKQNWVDSDDLAMIFEGTYTRGFYLALRDALHAEVETWNASEAAAGGVTHSGSLRTHNACDRVAGLWQTVEHLEKTCRNTEPSLSSMPV